MSLNGIKIQTTQSGVPSKVTFDLKKLHKTHPEIADMLEDILDIADADKHRHEPTKDWGTIKAKADKKHSPKS